VAIIDLGWRGKAVRDCPNVIVPTLAAPIGPTAGVNWAWGAFKTIQAATSPLGYDFLLTDTVIATGIGAGGTVDKAGGGGSLLHMQIDTGALTSESPVAEVMTASGIIFNVTGLGVGGSYYLYETSSHGLPADSALIPNASRISCRVTLSNSPDSVLVKVYLVGYNNAVLDFARSPCIVNDELFERSCRPSYSDLLPLAAAVTVVPAASWGTPGSWVQIPAGATLEDDYLITSGFAVPNTANPLSAQFEVSLGATNVIQARFPFIAIGTYGGGGGLKFKYPFIAYKGETMYIRCSSPADGTTENFLAGLRGVRLS